MIKYIHCFGTSYTAGGGFEFESTQYAKPLLKEVYSNCGEELTQYNFSWPGQLQKLIQKYNISVINHAKSGFGNERMYRIAYDLISDVNFNPNENLFIFEFSWLGRKEYFLNSLKDFVIVNYHNIEEIISKKKYEFHFEVGRNYYYDEPDVVDKLSKFRETAIDMFKNVFDTNILEKEAERNNSLFYNFLKQMGVNFLFSQQPVPTEALYDEKKDILFKDYRNHLYDVKIGNKVYTGLTDLLFYYGHEDENEYNITHETKKIITDGHFGLYGSKIAAAITFNGLIDKKYITADKIDLNSINRPKIFSGKLI